MNGFEISAYGDMFHLYIMVVFNGYKIQSIILIFQQNEI